jgi:hypothetical protein
VHFFLIFSLHASPIFELQELQNRNKKLILLTGFPHKIFGPWSWQFIFHWLHNCEWWQGASKLWGCKCMRHWGKHWAFDGQGKSTLTHHLLGGWLLSLSNCSNSSQGNFCQIRWSKTYGPNYMTFFSCD